MKHRYRTLLAVLLTLVLLAPLVVRAQEPADADDGDRVVLQAARRGNPWINLLDGRALPASYTGPAALTQALQDNLARPLSLAADDFDEDGVPDLVSGYVMSRNGSGILILHRGNVDAIYPHSPQAKARQEAGTFTNAPFLPSASVFELPAAPDFLGTGDFDNDGHRDVVAAARGGKALYLLPGDGQGGLGLPQTVKLPGVVTAWAVGEINRRDLLADLVVGVVGPGGPQVLVFEGRAGALRVEPEVLPLPAEATALALGQLDEHYAFDLAVAAGNEVLIVHGRDRGAATSPPVVDRHPQPFAIAALAVGNFSPEEAYPLEMALLSTDGSLHVLNPVSVEVMAQPAIQSPISDIQYPKLVRANVSSLPGDDLIVVDPTGRQVHILHTQYPVSDSPATLDAASEPAAVLPMRLNPDALSDLVVLTGNGPAAALTAPMATFTVVSPIDWLENLNIAAHDWCAAGDGVCAVTTWWEGQCFAVGPCTLRAAIDEANASPGTDEIRFDLGSGTPTISLGRALRIVNGLAIRESVTILGNTGEATRIAVRQGEGGIRQGYMFLLESESNTLRSLVIQDFHEDEGVAVSVWETGGNIFEDNYIGTSADGTASAPNLGSLWIYKNAPNNVIGGPVEQARNLISGNSDPLGFDRAGIAIDSSMNVVQGNYIGTDVSGTAVLANDSAGITLLIKGGAKDSSNNTIGGTTEQERNLISGNSGCGIEVNSGEGNLIVGNYIGTGKDGVGNLGNGQEGVLLDSWVDNNTIAGNVIAYNGGAEAQYDGIRLGRNYSGDGEGNRISQNSIHDNGPMGIDLTYPVGPNPNDPDDPDPPPEFDAYNRLQNWPEITDVAIQDGQLQVTFRVDTAPANATYLLDIEFFIADSVASGEGKTYLGTVQYLETEAQTVVTKSFAPEQMPKTDDPIVATATDAEGNTSEFSQVFGGGPVFKVDNAGNVYGNSYQTPAADFAEWWPLALTPGPSPNSGRGGLAPGDVLALGADGGVMLAGLPGAGPVIGVYATQPGFLAGGPQSVLRFTFHASRVPVALAGIVPVNISVENGPIRPGDLLALSSTPGVAARARPVSFGGREFYLAGSFFGKALETAQGSGTIRVLLTLQ